MIFVRILASLLNCSLRTHLSLRYVFFRHYNPCREARNKAMQQGYLAFPASQQLYGCSRSGPYAQPLSFSQLTDESMVMDRLYEMIIDDAEITGHTLLLMWQILFPHVMSCANRPGKTLNNRVVF